MFVLPQTNLHFLLLLPPFTEKINFIVSLPLKGKGGTVGYVFQFIAKNEYQTCGLLVKLSTLFC
jgi:hypothetical protein